MNSRCRAILLVFFVLHCSETKGQGPGDEDHARPRANSDAEEAAIQAPLAPESFKWERYEKNPVFPAVPGTWMESQTANPDLLLMGDDYFMYFRGQQNGHDRIGLATIPRDQFDGVTWSVRPTPVIDVGEPGSRDETHVLDPAAVLLNGRVYLYYSAVCPRCIRSVCLATSEDGVHFKKYQKNPIVIGGAPEAVVRDGILYLFFGKLHPERAGAQIHLATSRDGFDFTEHQIEPVLPVRPPGSWDSHVVHIPRIFSENGLYYMMYCGSDRFNDYPWHAGVAVSKDLVHWRKYEKNRVCSIIAWDYAAFRVRAMCSV